MIVPGVRWVLASTSPRRADLLRSINLSFTTLDPGLDDRAEAALMGEARRRGLDTAALVTRVAVAKLLCGLRRAEPGAALLSADTTIAFGDELLGKAPTEEAARTMLWRLRGESHHVHTGVAVLTPAGLLRAGVATSEVRMAAFDEATLEAYLACGVWRGKAGAYGVQDPEAGPLVAEVEGSLSNVKGLPLELVTCLLEL